MAGRRTDTRERIQQVALELFAERGYDKTSLQEVAERLEITRPALYYHFRTKEDILASVVDRLCDSIDELTAWAAEQPRTAESRREILRRMSELMEDQWRPMFRFAQVNQGVMQHNVAGERMRSRIVGMLSVLATPGASAVKQFEARLAVFAVILGSAPFLFDMDLNEAERADVALEVATKLVAD
ncbi:TetR/AcrR family transcriptional regulator [Nonomuraea gerenzanensis]|uniref:Transcriptional regulator, TetR family n=1 Tax=Nonomuraea gerenzanensis TaxID=93944 RepID=A0A1M4EIZ5_9ACTN|nr:TetR/AcrR family transcriptional regulator [Nonomuraea gerenzanensis]UBU10469.1 TetR/AcrR family transcriptional regulator [Nonomuraea gerenzanensis]SBO98865.1 Transcriptional regulator, TetR family [Nonomuraea gerenzanensis]